MKQRSRILLGAAVAALLPVLAATATHTGLTTLRQDTSLRSGPDGATAGFLPAGMDVEILKEQDGWLLVRLEGWVPADAVAAGAAEATDPDGESSAAGAAAVAAAGVTAAGMSAAGSDNPDPAADTTSAPPAGDSTTGSMAAGIGVGATTTAAGSAAAAAPAASGAIEGSLKLKTGRKKAKPVGGTAVYLMPGDPGADLLLYDETSAEKISELQAEAAKLKREADRAMEKGSFSVATREHDDLMRQRSKVVREMVSLQAAEHGSHAAMAAARAQATVASDQSGWYTFNSLQPGIYTVYARISASDYDVEWVEQVQVVSGVTSVQLDNVNVRGMP
jgi:hypothetical protein